MRSRYSAYALGRYDWLVESTHPDFREGLSAEKLAEQGKDVRWLRLEMGRCEDDAPVGENGELYDIVEFRAFYELGGIPRQLGEKSFFRRKDDKIYYVDASRVPAYRRPDPKVGRNDPVLGAAAKSTRNAAGRRLSKHGQKRRHSGHSAVLPGMPGGIVQIGALLP